jgi:hypothetical protein
MVMQLVCNVRLLWCWLCLRARHIAGLAWEGDPAGADPHSLRSCAGFTYCVAVNLFVLLQVNTYHISTLSSSQRPPVGTLPTGGAFTLAAGSHRRNSSSSAASSGGDSTVSDEAQSQAEQCETWIVMEYCEKGGVLSTFALFLCSKLLCPMLGRCG